VREGGGGACFVPAGGGEGGEEEVLVYACCGGGLGIVRCVYCVIDRGSGSWEARWDTIIPGGSSRCW